MWDGRLPRYRCGPYMWTELRRLKSYRMGAVRGICLWSVNFAFYWLRSCDLLPIAFFCAAIRFPWLFVSRRGNLAKAPHDWPWKGRMLALAVNYFASPSVMWGKVSYFWFFFPCGTPHGKLKLGIGLFVHRSHTFEPWVVFHWHLERKMEMPHIALLSMSMKSFAPRNT